MAARLMALNNAKASLHLLRRNPIFSNPKGSVVAAHLSAYKKAESIGFNGFEEIQKVDMNSPFFPDPHYHLRSVYNKEAALPCGCSACNGRGVSAAGVNNGGIHGLHTQSRVEIARAREEEEDDEEESDDDDEDDDDDDDDEDDEEIDSDLEDFDEEDDDDSELDGDDDDDDDDDSDDDDER